MSGKNETISPYQLFIPTFGGGADASTKTACFLPPFVHCRHFGHTSADMHTRALPWLPEHIKRPGIKSGAFVPTGGGERDGLGY